MTDLSYYADRAHSTKIGTALKIPFLRFQPLPKKVVSASGSESKKAYIAQIYYNITDHGPTQVTTCNPPSKMSS
jgi:hypothetical protein